MWTGHWHSEGRLGITFNDKYSSLKVLYNTFLWGLFSPEFSVKPACMTRTCMNHYEIVLTSGFAFLFNQTFADPNSFEPEAAK